MPTDRSPRRLFLCGVSVVWPVPELHPALFVLVEARVQVADVELLGTLLRPQVVLQIVGHVVGSRQLDRLQPIDERVRLRRRLAEVRESARLVDGDRNEVLDQVRLLLREVRDPDVDKYSISVSFMFR